MRRFQNGSTITIPFTTLIYLNGDGLPSFSMSEEDKRPRISLKVEIGPLEITVMNYAEHDLQSALRASLEAIESNSGKISTLIEKYKSIHGAEKDAVVQAPGFAQRLHWPLDH
jgi:hypothetical protein